MKGRYLKSVTNCHQKLLLAFLHDSVERCITFRNRLQSCQYKKEKLLQTEENSLD